METDLITITEKTFFHDLFYEENYRRYFHAVSETRINVLQILKICFVS